MMIQFDGELLGLDWESKMSASMKMWSEICSPSGTSS